jgi:quinol monooxygenase YgiN
VIGMYGMINKITAKPGDGNALQQLLLDGSRDMAGCVSYVVSADMADSNVLWITEVWQSEADHKASLDLPAVRSAIGKAMPMIAKFDSVAKLRPIGGKGID